MNKYLIVSNPELHQNFPKLFRNQNSKTIAIGFTKSSLSEDKYVDEFRLMKAGSGDEFIQSVINNKKLLKELNGLILWGDDEIMYQIANSKIAQTLKLRILPVRKQIGLQILGSKVGQSKIFKNLELKTPKTEIIKSANQLKQRLKNFQGPFIIKGDRLGGGALVRKYESRKGLSLKDVDESWYPIVLQDFINGPVISVEAFFKKGKLVAWIYSAYEGALGEFGPSFLRTYKNPSNLDFEADLIKLADHCGLDGMFNCTYILSGSSHYLIEADGRPNSWHFLFDHFKLPIMQIYQGEMPLPNSPLSPKIDPNKSEKIIDLNRSINHAINQKDKKLYFYSILKLFNSTNWISGRRIQLIKQIARGFKTLYPFSLRKGSFLLLVKTFRKLPVTWQKPFKKSGATKFIAHTIFRL